MREVFPEIEPTPKMHTLSMHMEEVLARKGSLGMGTEQGIEALHPEINYIRNNYRHMDRNPEAQMTAVMKQAHVRGGGKRERACEGVMDAKHQRSDKAREKKRVSKWQ